MKTKKVIIGNDWESSNAGRVAMIDQWEVEMVDSYKCLGTIQVFS